MNPGDDSQLRNDAQPEGAGDVVTGNNYENIVGREETGVVKAAVEDDSWKPQGKDRWNLWEI